METQEVTGNGTIGEGEGRDLTFSDLLGRAGSIPALGTISFNELQQDDTEVVRWYQLAAGPGQGTVQVAKFVMLIRTS